MLDANLVMLLGLIAIVLTQGIKFIFARLGKPIHRGWITVATYVVSCGVAVLWDIPTFPVLPVMSGDPSLVVNAVLTYAGEILALVSTIVGFATLIYNVLLEKVFDKLGLTPSKIPF